ncbi:Predicted dehydrogenase [Halohasta litchfieldiae]|jgi:predicted dehydrogenase|uniref:Predicted dehydrogenase n=1 Tax=Halohasta litchfieldiae TaxID=1073996 RepID=A0A1H6YFW9_9EURY|nr:Gfo/Idh/MocA family oxidoreductase [Halohasta litchfieldiae]SEJ36110.1 Predicted dehydrogenase [Halohasta litchfieldiae]
MDTALFFGLGSIGRRHLSVLQELDSSVEVHAYRSQKADPDEFPNVIQHDELDEALSVNPDVAFITNPTSLHVETAITAAEHGCHLFIEKPLSDTLAGTEQLSRVVATNDLITYVACVFRFHPVLKYIKTQLENNVIGTVYNYRVFSGSYLPDWRPEQDYRESYSADPDMGGGVVLDLIHEIDYAYWLFGDVLDTKAWVGQLSELEIESEDFVEAIVSMESGAVGQIHLDYYRPEPRRTIEITGSDGIITGDLLDGTVTVTANQETIEKEFEFERNDLFRSQLSHFLTHVRNGDPCDNDVEQGRTVLEIALGIKFNNE